MKKNPFFAQNQLKLRIFTESNSVYYQSTSVLYTFANSLIPVFVVHNWQDTVWSKHLTKLQFI